MHHSIKQTALLKKETAPIMWSSLFIFTDRIITNYTSDYLFAYMDW